MYQRECGKGRVSNGLAPSEAEGPQEASATSCDVLDDGALDVDLEFEEVDPLPVRPVQSQNVPSFGNLQIEEQLSKKIATQHRQFK